jgi:hypothetical protein
MNIHTARQIKGNPDGHTAKSIASASGKSLESVTREAERTLREYKRQERKRRGISPHLDR